MTSPSRGGRPTRDARSRKALRGVDIDAVTPERTLREIMADKSQSGGARVAAAKALQKIEAAKTRETPLLAVGEADGADADLNQRALALMERSQGRTAN